MEAGWNVPGTRMMRYFGWHEEKESPLTSLSFSTMSTHPMMVQ
jgi:hypothetical protein